MMNRKLKKRKGFTLVDIATIRIQIAQGKLVLI